MNVTTKAILVAMGDDISDQEGGRFYPETG